MGCLKKFIHMAIFLIVVFAFFALGGCDFVKDKYYSYTQPQRAVFVEEEQDFGNLENVSADYALTRSLNFFGYRKLNAFYLPKKQRITILDLNSDDILSEKDFQKGIIEKKLEEFSGKIVNSPIMPLENIAIRHLGKVKAGSYEVPYVDFEANVKMIPFFKMKGTVAIYKSQNRDNIVSKFKKKENVTTKLLISCNFPTGYEDKITRNFISQIKL